MRALAIVAALGGFAAAVVLLSFHLSVRAEVRPLPRLLPPHGSEVELPRPLHDRHGRPLTSHYGESWNRWDRLPAERTPPLLERAFVVAEDRRFHEHAGVDWRARLAAALQNLRAGRVVRGASTLSEQVVGMLHPRPSSLRSRWLEGLEARELERRFSKARILAFYLDQVPYGRQRRGVVQAARLYFDRDVDTLSVAETLALAVLVRSPSRLDPAADPEGLRRRTVELARRMHRRGELEAAELAAVEHWAPRPPLATVEVDVGHWAREVRSRLDGGFESGRTAAPVVTTLDGSLQQRVQAILDGTLERLADREVGDGAVLVVDHDGDEILAWVNGGGFDAPADGQIDMVTSPRQPGSTLKPFLYALALEQGWTAATVIDDAPLLDPVGHGMHAYRNYSRTFYGPVRLRDALGNSLNTPAVRAIKQVGVERFHARLRQLGFDSLAAHPEHYGEGLALGNGEVSLYQLVRAYAVLARGGEARELRASREEPASGSRRERVLDPEVATLVADVLADAGARRLEFGADSVLALPRPTAVKTGTSNDHRDAWTIGFSDRYTVGVWMGNVDRRPMVEVSGSVGPALVFRAVMAELHRQGEGGALPLARTLERHRVCALSGRRPGNDCPTVEEWFRPGSAPGDGCDGHDAFARASAEADGGGIRIESPTPGLHLALDPRIPDFLEGFAFELSSDRPVARVEWWLDGERVAETGAEETRWVWTPTRGRHLLEARVWPGDGGGVVSTPPIGFEVR